MSPKTRIVVNTLASYCRSIFAIGFGLFSVRWVLEVLGVAEYGLFTLIGSLIAFISFLNNILGISVARYYAYAIGEADIKGKTGYENLSRWFNTALSIHLCVPILLIVIGYPLAVFAIRHWLKIPAGRVETCIWVFRISLVTAFVSMSSVPFIAMYTARQLISVLSFFGIGATFLNFVFAFALFYVGTDKLLTYAVFMMIVNAGIPLVQILWAFAQFKECRIRLTYWGDWKRLRSLLSFAGWTTFGFGGYTFGHQGNVVLTNQFFGSAMNASYGIAAQLTNHTGALSNALMGAMAPVITSCEGSGDRQRTIRLALRSGRIGGFLLILFGVPLLLELPEVIRLWLGKLPECVVPICSVALCSAIVSKLTLGHQMAMNASGKIALWQFFEGTILAAMVGFGFIFILSGFGSLSAALGCLCSSIVSAGTVLIFCHMRLNMNISLWFQHVAGPIAAITIVTILFAGMSVWLLPPSFLRILVTTACSLAIMLPLGWLIILEDADRDMVKVKLHAVIGHILRR